MRLYYSSGKLSMDYISNTVMTDDFERQRYATHSRRLGYKLEVLKYDEGSTEPSNLASLSYDMLLGSDNITFRGKEMKAREYLAKVSNLSLSRRRRFTSSSGRVYEWHTNGLSQSLELDGNEVGRSHVRSLGIVGSSKHGPYLEVSDHPDIISDLDEIVTTFLYLQSKYEKEMTYTTVAASS